MRDREVTPDHKVFRVFKACAAKSDRKVIQAAKDRKAMSDLKDQWDQQDRQVRLVHKEILAFRDPEESRDQLV